MDEHDWVKKLHAEGFTRTYVWHDRPLAYYPDHTHPVLSAHIILEGEMTLTMDGETHTYAAGERCEVPANTLHSARIGLTGCRYLIGEK